MAAWPFSNAAAPTLDSGVTDVPIVLTAVTAAVSYLLGIRFQNPTAASITIRVTDTAGNDIIPTTEVPAGLPFVLSVPFEPVTGVKWIAGGAGLKGHIWGY